MAERAIERAADLARNAERAAPGFRNVDAFHFVRPRVRTFSRQPQQPFSRAVVRNLFGDHLGPREGEPRFELGAQLLGDAGYRVERGRAADIDPVPELL